jgi:phosphatidylserine/phosphatidylglycerophosphate/cardiolipin synthase-like enzyme
VKNRSFLVSHSVKSTLLLLFLISALFLSPLYGDEINAYFSHSVDTSLADPQKANGSVSLDEKLIERISSSQYSIDFCFYNISRENVVDSLISTFNRGVDIRVITENDNFGNQGIQDLLNAGIPVIDDSFGNNLGEYLMHNKFAVFDFRDSSSTSDDWIWTGSYNTTNTGTESNANNALEIQNFEIAQAYTTEFEEMWGSSTNIPNPDSSRFSFLKTNNTQHFFFVNSIPLELYFSPSDHSTQHIRSAVSTVDSTIYFCIFAFTRQNLCDNMKTKWDSGILVKGVFDSQDWLGNFSKSRDMTGDPLSANPWIPPAPVFADSVHSPWGPELLHHKYIIVDSDCSQPSIVITGSQNWSNSGDWYNDENTLIIYNNSLANQYLQEFVERYREAGGVYVGCKESEVGSQKTKDRFSLEVYPNPFNSVATITVERVSDHQNIRESELKIYDISGRMVREIYLFPFTFFLGAIATWDGRDDGGKVVTPGIYFIHCTIENKTYSKKIIRLK